MEALQVLWSTITSQARYCPVILWKE